MENYTEDLNDIFQDKIENRKNVSENEIYQLLLSITDGLVCIQDQGIRNLVIDDHSIVFSNGKLKILDSIIGQPSILDRIKKPEDGQGNLYLSP